MENISIKILSVEDRKNGEKLIEGVDKKDIIKCNNIHVGIIEREMVSEMESVMIAGETPGGKIIFMEISGDNFQAISKIHEGSRFKFKLEQSNREGK